MNQSNFVIAGTSGFGSPLSRRLLLGWDAQRSASIGAFLGIGVMRLNAPLDALRFASRLSRVLIRFACIVGFLLAAGCAVEKPATVAHPELAVVRIRSTLPGGAATEGIGFLVSPDGLVATCNRLVDSRAYMTATFPDGHSLPAKFVQEDREGHVALIKVEGDKLPFLPLQGDDFLPGVHIRAVGTGGAVNGEFEQFENSGSDVGFTVGGSVESGSPLLLDDNTVIGVVQGAAGNRPGVQLATPVWRIARMMPAKAPEQ